MRIKGLTKSCENCGNPLILKSHRDYLKKRFCSRKCNGTFFFKDFHTEEWVTKSVAAGCTPESNRKKALYGSSNGRWIQDRTKLKAKRFYKEEKDFIKSLLEKRNYTCELTGRRGGKLSAHHKNSYKDFPNQRFDEDNIVIIRIEIHRLFHKLYGTNNITEEKWNNFVKNREYYAVIQ